MRPLILLIEKDELPEDLPGTGGDPPTDDTPPEDDAEASEAPKDEPSEDSGDAAAADEGGDDDATLDDDDDAGGGEESDPVGEQLRRERLYDAIVDIQQQCEQLSSAADVLVDRIEDKTAKMFAVRAKQIVDDTITQCDVIRSRFADLGYERVRELYATTRERVSAVAEIIKHVIDGDDDFRKTDSGNPQRNGSAAKQGRGRSE